ncbi:MAG: hypothetical protein HYZ81_25555 [Nitrospinae bacterium]|nr:hypothetical protein [Nitrospinota bacterium]
MGEVISPQLVKVLTEVTGEMHLDSALRILARDAIDHRLKQLDARLLALEHQYGCSFESFDRRFQAGEIPNQHAYAIEQDYLEWEGLLSRQRHLLKVRMWLQ